MMLNSASPRPPGAAPGQNAAFHRSHLPQPQTQSVTAFTTLQPVPQQHHHGHPPSANTSFSPNTSVQGYHSNNLAAMGGGGVSTNNNHPNAIKNTLNSPRTRMAMNQAQLNHAARIRAAGGVVTATGSGASVGAVPQGTMYSSSSTANFVAANMSTSDPSLSSPRLPGAPPNGSMGHPPRPMMSGNNTSGNGNGNNGVVPVPTPPPQHYAHQSAFPPVAAGKYGSPISNNSNNINNRQMNLMNLSNAGGGSDATYGSHGVSASGMVNPYASAQQLPNRPQKLSQLSVQPPASSSSNNNNNRRRSSGGSSRAKGVPPPVSRGPQPTCLDPTRLPNGQRIKKKPVNPSGQNMNGPQGLSGPQRVNGERRASRFASMRQLPGGVKLNQSNLSEDDDASDFSNSSSSVDEGGQKRKRANFPKTGPGAAGFRPPSPRQKDGGANGNNGRKIKTTVGNDETWMKGLTHTTWVDSPMGSARGENQPYKRKPKDRRRAGKNKKSSSYDTDSNGDTDSSAGSTRPKKTFVEKLKDLFAS